MSIANWLGERTMYQFQIRTRNIYVIRLDGFYWKIFSIFTVIFDFPKKNSRMDRRWICLVVQSVCYICGQVTCCFPYNFTNYCIQIIAVTIECELLKVSKLCIMIYMRGLRWNCLGKYLLHFAIFSFILLIHYATLVSDYLIVWKASNTKNNKIN